ncbi:unnamed protein product [Enterobius vermicularis]|uniref:BTB domain-containing protein n=1 Tax=Enterobius vermicularis TaxID=51028 RepID=A0A0N4VKY7_ENTVE|nr:unnamed protein product [Enterobius vermicularis]
MYEHILQYRCPNSFLTQFAGQTHEERLENCDGYIVQSQEYFFERSGLAFECIYDFLTTGHIHRPAFICRDRIYREIEFWKISSGFFAPCCMVLEEDSDDDEGPGDSSVDYEDQFDNVRYGRVRRSVWYLMEEPSSSNIAKVFALASISMIIISVTAMIMGSLPELQNAPESRVDRNDTVSSKHDHDLRQNIFFDYIEMICIIWFSIEYIVRFIVCTRKWRFIVQPLNMIDSLSIIPFFIEIALNLAGFGANKIGDFRGIAMIMRVIRVMRVARIFKLARYSNGLKSFGVTVKTSLPELSMLTLFLVTAIIFFSTLMYFAERDEPETKFRSIPHAGWWYVCYFTISSFNFAFPGVPFPINDFRKVHLQDKIYIFLFRCIVTMTTVGYGDFTPKTLFGRIIASCASISGVLVLAFPITMIVENFSKTYDTEKNEIKAVQRQRRMAKAYA